MTFMWCHAAPRLSLYIWLVFLPLSLALSSPAIFSWPFPQTDGSVESAISTHVILFLKHSPCSFLSERYLFNKWNFNLPVVGPFYFSWGRCKKSLWERQTEAMTKWKSSVLVFFYPGSPRSRLYHCLREPKERFSPSECNLAEGHFFRWRKHYEAVLSGPRKRFWSCFTASY